MFVHTTAAMAAASRHDDLEAAAARRRVGRRSGRRSARRSRESLASALRPPATWPCPGATTPAPSH